MRPAYALARRVCQFVFVTFFRGRVFGRRHVPAEGGVLLVSNHQSFLDPVLATLAIPRECNYMARHTLFENRKFRRLIEYLNAYPVKRDTADIGAIKETLRRLKADRVVLAFAEGTRTPDGRVGPFHAGVVLLARKARVPIVPVVILGAFEAWPRQAKLPRPSRIIVAYGEPLDLATRPNWTDEECVTAVRDRVLALQEHYEPLLRPW
jgi:1-acyl-sn-glycerol-3-phosphate acyltransferase